MVRFENVGMRYGPGPEVLRDVTFRLDAGSFTFLTGPSGAGKTTLLKLMYLAEPPSRGLITLFGEELASLRRKAFPALRRRIGVVFQDFRLLAHLSAFDNVALPLRLAGGRADDYDRDVEELLTWVGLGDRMHAKPATLSGGEQQRVAIARAVVARPDLLLADEPTGNVDADIGERLIRLFGELNRLGTTVLIATHDRSLIERSKAREMRLVDGRLIELRTGRT
ncbi:MAG TPA: cell division ATP-binding protein FtsE [Rhizomicrobium sp.]|nr:cell division ATP-binding protein FtsE [Rhizomicrobium sp.]